MNSCGGTHKILLSEQSRRPADCLCVAPLVSSAAGRDRHGAGGFPHSTPSGPCPAGIKRYLSQGRGPASLATLGARPRLGTPKARPPPLDSERSRSRRFMAHVAEPFWAWRWQRWRPTLKEERPHPAARLFWGTSPLGVHTPLLQWTEPGCLGEGGIQIMCREIPGEAECRPDAESDGHEEWARSCPVTGAITSRSLGAVAFSRR